MRKTPVIIFCDTNILFWLFYRHVSWKPIFRSALLKLASSCNVYISQYILSEIVTVFQRDYDITVTNQDIHSFFKMSWFRYKNSPDRIDAKIINYVSDIHDAPVLQDAILIKANYLLTNNIKDFDSIAIRDAYNIEVIDYIPDKFLW